MKTFTYTITDALGIHARPAGNLVKLAKTFKSKLFIEKDGKSSDLTKLMALMGMGIKCGNTINVSADGDDEDVAINALEEFFKQNL